MKIFFISEEAVSSLTCTTVNVTTAFDFHTGVWPWSSEWPFPRSNCLKRNRWGLAMLAIPFSIFFLNAISILYTLFIWHVLKLRNLSILQKINLAHSFSLHIWLLAQKPAYFDCHPLLGHVNQVSGVSFIKLYMLH